MTKRQKIGTALAFAIVPGTVFLDVLFGLATQFSSWNLSRLSPGLVGRGLVLVFGVLALMIDRHPTTVKLRKWTLLIGGSLAVSVALTVATTLDANIPMELNLGSKILYGPILTGLLCIIIRRYRLAPSILVDHLIIFGSFIALSVLVPTLLGVGTQTYGDYAAGSTGFLLAQNDVGVSLSISYIAALHSTIITNKRWPIIAAIVIGLALMELGTRFGTIASVFFPVVIIGLYRDRLVSRSNYGRVLGAGLIGAPVAGWFFLQRIQLLLSQEYNLRKYQSLLAGQVTRSDLLDKALLRLTERPLWMDLFGEGVVSYRRNVGQLGGIFGEMDYAEIDPVDMFGAYGIAGLTAIYLFYFTMWRRISLIPTVEKTLHLRLFLHLGFGTLFLHSFLAGHVVAGAMPLSATAPLIAVVLLTTSKQRLYREPANESMPSSAERTPKLRI